MTTFPFNSKSNYNITSNENTSSIKNFFTELNSVNESSENSAENVAGINCKYYDSEEFIENFSNSKCFSAFHLNISSLTKHFDELHTLLSLLNVNFSVIGITETKFLKNTQTSINFSLQNYTTEHTPTELSSGGALLYISNHLTYKPRKDLNQNMYKSKELESIFVEIVYEKRKNLVIGCVYKHPKMCTEYFNSDFLYPLLDKVNKEKKSLILMGDFNINLLNSDNDKSVSNFLDILGSFSLLPQVIFPTRVTNFSKTLIDNIFFDSSNSKTFSGNLTWNISDHYPQFLLIKNIFSNKKIKHNIHQRNWNKFDPTNFILDFLDINWNSTLELDQKNVDVSFQNFYNKINTLTNKYAPLRKLTRKQVNTLAKPWVTKGIQIAIHKRNKLQKLFKNTKDPTLKISYELEFKKYRNMIVSLTRKSKKKSFL